MSTAISLLPVMPVGWLRRGGCALLLVLAVWEFSYRLGAVPFLDDPNEAEYAEVAREMVETGEWISPQLNYVVFLNKPPLAYWLIGMSYLTFGINEFAARLPMAVAGVLIVFLLYWLGTILFDVETALLAGFILIAMGGFLVETHEVRPDLILTASIVASLVAVARLLRAGSAGDGWALVGFQLAVGLGVLAKGMLAVVVPALVIAVLIVGEQRFDLIRRLLHPRAWWLLVLLVAPWHVLISVRHPGALWDYVVNQHILFFFDRKFPRDSVPVSVPVFWGAFALRLFPWTLFAPLAILAAVRRVRSHPGGGDRLLLAWVFAVLLFFSAALSRMEHYSIPALPAMALLIAKLFRDYGTNAAPRLTRATTAHVVLFAILMLATPFAVPRIFAAQAWLAPIHEIPVLARSVFGLFAAGALVAAAAALAARRGLVAPALVASVVCAIPLLHNGMALMARVNSSRPMAAALGVLAEPGEELVYEAPVEYQNCAGFNFYLRRKLVLLRPADFVAPPYLEPHVNELFISREQLEQRWQDRRVFLITDPLHPRPHLDGTVPQPVYIVARDNVRWVVTNRPLN